MKKILYFVLIIGMTSCGKNDHNQHTSSDPYYCPMHPEVTSAKPSVCPICHMDLVKSGGDAEQDKSAMLSQMNVDAFRQVLANVGTIKVRKERRTHSLRAYGTLDFAEPNRKIIAARFSGRVERLVKNQTGQRIAEGETLFETYSSDVVQTENEYLSYFQSHEDQSFKRSSDTVLNLRATALQAISKRLQIMGISMEQIQELEKKREPHWRLPVYSPYPGVIIRKNINEGAYFGEGDALYEIDDLSVLWNIFEVYENDIHHIRSGMAVAMRFYAFPNDTFYGKISYIYPSLNPATRTLKVRAELKNPGFRLRPQMSGETYIVQPSEPAIYVPQTAVIITGKRNVIWIRKTGNAFVPVDVELGYKSGDEYEILSGLSEGMEIAVSGGYLIESESQLSGFR